MPPTITAGKTIAMLRSAIVNARIYPQGSQMIETAVQGAYQALTTCLESAPQIIVSDLHGKLCIDGKEAPEAREFIAFLAQHDVQSIKFLRGVTPAEIAALVEGLGKQKGKLQDHKNLDVWLKDQGVRYILAEEIQFAALQKGETVIQEVLGLLQDSGDTGSMIGALGEAYRRMDQLPDPEERTGVQRQIAQHIVGLPPHQLREFLESKLPDAAEKSSLKETVVQTLSQEKLEETLEEVHKWFDKIKKESASELEVLDKLTGLKSFLAKILQAPASKKVSFALYEELLSRGLVDDVPSEVKEGAESSLMAQVEHLLHQPCDALLDPAVRQGLPDLVKGLCALGRDERVQMLVEKILENLQNPTPLVRGTTVKTLHAFEEILATNRKEALFSMVATALHQLADTESAPDVYAETVQALQDVAMELLVNWHFEESAAILATLRRHSQESSPISQKKKEFSAKALRIFSGRGLEVVCADLNSPSKDRQNGAYRVLAEMGETAVDPLLAALAQAVDSRSKQAIIQALKRLGPAVKEPLLKKMQMNQPAEILVKFIPLLEDYNDVSLLPMLSSLLQHPDATVRHQLMQLLPQIEQPQIQPMLIAMLDDTDLEIQGEAVRALSSLRAGGALVELTKRLVAAAPPVQEKICVAMGDMGNRSAVPALVDLLMFRSPFWKRLWQHPDPGREAVRIRAAAALGQLLPDPAAEKALVKALNDPANLVRRAAQAALKNRRQPPKQTPN